MKRHFTYLQKNTSLLDSNLICQEPEATFQVVLLLGCGIIRHHGREGRPVDAHARHTFRGRGRARRTADKVRVARVVPVPRASVRQRGADVGDAALRDLDGRLVLATEAPLVGRDEPGHAAEDARREEQVRGPDDAVDHARVQVVELVPVAQGQVHLLHVLAGTVTLSSRLRRGLEDPPHRIRRLVEAQQLLGESLRLAEQVEYGLDPVRVAQLAARQRAVDLHADFAAADGQRGDAANVSVGTVLRQQPRVVLVVERGRQVADGEELVARHGEHLEALVRVDEARPPHFDEVRSALDVRDVFVEALSRCCQGLICGEYRSVDIVIFILRAVG